VPKRSATTTSKTCQPDPKGLGWFGIFEKINKNKIKQREDYRPLNLTD
jgi:hypothetical protein